MALMAQCFPDRHNTSLDESWLSCQIKASPNPDRGDSHWILYDFGETYELGQSHFWNLNVPERTTSGINTAVIDYSIDGVTWFEFGTFTLAEANASGFYEGEDGPDLNGTVAQFVLVTILENYGGDCFGFSEMRIATSGVSVSVDELDKIIEGFALHPNPAIDKVNVNFIAETKGPASIQLVDMAGKVVSEKNIYITYGNNSYSFDVSSHAAGQYLIQLNKEDRIKTTKLSILNK